MPTDDTSILSTANLPPAEPPADAPVVPAQPDKPAKPARAAKPKVWPAQAEPHPPGPILTEAEEMARAIEADNPPVPEVPTVSTALDTPVPALEVPSLPREHSGWIVPGLPDGGVPVEKWSGDPAEEVMPGEDVLYWVRSDPPPPPGQKGWLIAMPAKILGRLSSGAYRGHRYRAIHAGVYAMTEAWPSATPKLDHFTARKKFPPEQCRID